MVHSTQWPVGSKNLCYGAHAQLHQSSTFVFKKEEILIGELNFQDAFENNQKDKPDL